MRCSVNICWFIVSVVSRLSRMSMPYWFSNQMLNYANRKSSFENWSHSCLLACLLAWKQRESGKKKKTNKKKTLPLQKWGHNRRSKNVSNGYLLYDKVWRSLKWNLNCTSNLAMNLKDMYLGKYKKLIIINIYAHI